MDSEALKSLRDWMERMVKLREPFAQRDTPYLCMEDFILRHGRANVGRTLPNGYELGEIKQCFANSQRELPIRDDLTFVEGYVLRPDLIPIHHGWLEDESGRVVDLTLPDETTVYFGVAFQTLYVLRMVREHMTWGTLIDNYWARFPLLRGEHKPEEAIILSRSAVHEEATREA